MILIAWQSYRMIDREPAAAALSRRAAVSVLAKPPKLREVREALAQLCAGPQRTEKNA